MALRTQTKALEALRGMAAEPLAIADHPAPHSSVDSPERLVRPGRPAAEEETMQISLRLPKAWLSVLRRRAVEASTVEEKTISPQEVVRRLVGRSLGTDG